MQTGPLRPMKLRPYISETVWGGRRLVQNYHIDPQGKANAAEAWALSAHPSGCSVIEDGPLAGQTLAQLFAEQPAVFGINCAKKEKFPVLVKLIDAQDNLSLQVHPRDGDAVLRPGEAGKTECWYILEAQPGAKLYVGLREAVTPAQFSNAIENQNVMALVRAFDVKPGDFFFIPAGTVHAIGKGVLLAEVQQSSDTTYRVYDYNRLQNGLPRELHVEQACAVADLLPYELQRQEQDTPGARTLCACEFFSVEEHSGSFSGQAGKDSFVHLLVLEASKDAALAWKNEAINICKGDSILIPAGMGKFSVNGNARVLATRV